MCDQSCPSLLPPLFLFCLAAFESPALGYRLLLICRVPLSFPFPFFLSLLFFSFLYFEATAPISRNRASDFPPHGNNSYSFLFRCSFELFLLVILLIAGRQRGSDASQRLVMSKKCFVCWIQQSVEARDSKVFLFDEEIELVWVQGVLVDYDGEQQEATIDDGTGVLQLSFQNARQQYDLSVGQYLLAQGHVIVGLDEESGTTISYLDAKRLEPLMDCNFESLWQLEVVQSQKLAAKR